MTDYPMTDAVEAAAKHLYDRRHAMSRTAMSPWNGLHPNQIEYELKAAQRLIDVIAPILRAQFAEEAAATPKPNCNNCGKPGPHFVVPSFAVIGSYTCNRKDTK